MYIQSDPLGDGDKAFQGASFFTAPNPPFGATFTYYLKDSLKTKKSCATGEGSRTGAAGPGHALSELGGPEGRGPRGSAAVVLTIRDSAGEVVRQLPAPSDKGMHRVTWDFRYNGYTPVQLGGDSFGPLAVPGQYTVSISTRLDGKLTELVPPTPFDVEPLGMASLPEPNRQATLAFQKQTGELQRAVYGAYRVAQETAEQLKYIRRALETAPGIDPNLAVEARALELRLQDILERFEGDPTKPRRNEPGMPGILSRLQTVVSGHWSTHLRTRRTRTVAATRSPPKSTARCRTT